MTPLLERLAAQQYPMFRFYCHVLSGRPGCKLQMMVVGACRYSRIFFWDRDFVTVWLTDRKGTLTTLIRASFSKILSQMLSMQSWDET